MTLLSQIKEQARLLGFDACGAAPYRTLQTEASVLRRWLDSGFHSCMSYMEKHIDMRTDPALLVEGTKSVIVCLSSYKTAAQYPAGIPRISAYARSTDYHYTLKKQLNLLLDSVKELIPNSDGRAFVDSAPVFEKSWAKEAGLGLIGKNTLLIHPDLGSFCFIGILFLTCGLDEYDTPYPENRCGDCRRCVDHCPTGALREDGFIDTNRCISCQTIENRKEMPESMVPFLGDRLYGCDTCQDVCPWNKKPQNGGHLDFAPPEGLYEITAEEWISMGGGEFRRRFGHTPMARTGLKKLKLTLQQKSF